MANYNLSDNVEDTFEFEINNKKYVMRYPTTVEVEKIQDITISVQSAQDAKDEPEVKKLSKQLERYFYSFITPVEHEEKIEDVLASENIRVIRNFNNMIKTELSIQ